MIKVACAFSCGQTAVVLETEANEKINLSVGHIYGILDRLFGRIVVGQEGQFVGEFGSMVWSINRNRACIATDFGGV